MKNLSKPVVLLTIAFLATCGSKQVKENKGKTVSDRESRLLKNYNTEKDNKYKDLIVDLNKYTTNGGVYQKRYYRLLIGVAVDIVDNKKLNIIRGSIGFYYDRKSLYKDRLYLGLDIDTGITDNNPYGQVAVEFLRKNLRDISNTINSCRSLFREKEIVGMVIGFRWTSDGKEEQVNIWINEEDIIRFEKRNLTFDEIIQKSTITNTQGNIIKLRL